MKFTGKVVTGYLGNVNHNSVDLTTTYTITQNNVADAINGGSPLSSEFKFKNYVNSSSFSDTQHIQLIKNGLVLCPAYRVGQGITLSTAADGSSISLVIGNSTAMTQPFGFTNGSIRAVVPFEYNVTNFSSSTVRTKTSATASDSFSALLTDTDSRKYVRLSNYDVYSITKVIRTSDGINISSDFELDDGQKDTFYDYSRLYVKPSKASSYSTGVAFSVEYKYYQHGGFTFAPFVGSHSYPDYASIPLYTSKRTGKTVSLANCLDFRHSGPQNSSSLSKPYGVSENFGSVEFTTATYTHYLPRIDKLKLSTNPTDNSAIFSIDAGVPDLSPVAPPDTEDSLTLYSLTVPAYTHNPKDVLLSPFDNKRYTMADIGKIEKRMDEIETFARLTASEENIQSRSIAPILGVSTEPLKTSLYTDSLFGHGGADVISTDHICSVDYENGEVRPFFTHTPLSLTSEISAGTTVSSDGICTMNYSTVPYISHDGYTDRVAANPSGTVNWMGYLTINRPFQTQWDTGYRPLVRTNTLSENDNWIASNPYNRGGFGTQWNDWENYWTGIDDKEEEYDVYKKKFLEVPKTVSISVVPSLNSGNVSVGTNRNQKPDNELIQQFVNSKQLRNHIRTRVNSRVIDKSVVPYVPSNSITVNAYGLKPSTLVYTYMDGVLMTPSPTKTDSNGSCSVTFTIPPNTFLAGEKRIRIADNSSIQNCTTAAESVYYCGGVFQQRDSGSYSTRPPILRRQTVTSEGIIKDPFNRDVSYDNITDSVENIQWCDPLSQTFIVDKKTTPYGVFLKNVSLYFSSKDSTLPVTIQIRPTVSGYPSPSVVIPFTTVTKLPSDITVGKNSVTNQPLGTKFEFSSPVYLEPGEYAITILTNSSKYNMYAIQSGLPLSNGNRAGASPLVGNLFIPQTIGTAVKNNGMDLAFSVERCDFSNTASATITYTVTGCGGSHVAKIYAPEIIPITCTVTRTFDGTQIFNNQNIWANTIISSTPQLTYTMSRGLSSYVSPVVDLGAIFGIAAKMQLDSSLPSASSGYVTKAVTLPDENISSGLFVVADTCNPLNSDIVAYYRYSTTGEGDLFDMPWIPMTKKTAFVSTSELDFRESRWVATAPNMKSYQLRFVFLCSPTVAYDKTPALRNIRVVSYR